MSAASLAALPEALADARRARGLTAAALAARSGVSRAMIGKIERGQAQPTAALLARLSGALGLRLSELLASVEASSRKIARPADQPVWVDPETRYRRRLLSPSVGGPIELIEVELPPGAAVSYPPEAYAFIHQQIWVLEGVLTLTEGETTGELERGDCVEFGPPVACTLANRGAVSCRYLVAITARAR
jgi:transcriptional regulator with XRE-family HTH domain